MLNAVQPLVEAGAAVHWLHPRSKRPIGDDWSEKPVYSFDELRLLGRPDANVGIRLGEPSRIGELYLHMMDVDVRSADQADAAFAALAELLPEWASFPIVRSGSGGASRHVYFLTDRPFRSGKLAYSGERFTDSLGKAHWTWEVELFGSGKQAVLPPSIHPDTLQLYVWEREFDFDLIDLGLGPVIGSERVAKWAPAPRSAGVDQDDLITLANSQPGNFTDAQIRETLNSLPLDAWCVDREGWLKVGMALHHQFQGSEEGYDLWEAFSKQARDKFNARNQRQVWKSFSSRSGSLRFQTLYKAANEARAAQENAKVNINKDIEDLIGGVDDEYGPTVGWKRLLDKNKDTQVPKATLHNAVLILANDPRMKGLPAHNRFTQEVVQRTPPGRLIRPDRDGKGTKQLRGAAWGVEDTVNGTLWNNIRDVAIRDIIEAPEDQGGYGFRVTDRDLKGAIDQTARENAFHPVQEYLESVTWDGEKRIERLFIDYLGCPDNSYHRSIGRLFMVAAVTRIYEPGHKFDFAVILEGLQGKRKSTFIEILAKRWFSELDGDLHDTQSMVESMQGSWILEIPELSSFRRTDVRTLKAFISRTSDKVRLAYERRAEMFARQCVFIGSTNDNAYLQDDTGGRRFWPAHCEVAAIDTDRLRQNVDLMWAEAYRVYRDMRREQPRGSLALYLTDPQAQAEAANLQESRRIETAEDTLSGQIGAWLDRPVTTDPTGFENLTVASEPQPRQQTCLAEIWVECLDRNISQYGQVHAQQLGRAMRKLGGWREAGQSRTEKYGKQRVFQREG